MAITQIGVNIAELRKAKGVKQEDVVKAVGISAQAVTLITNKTCAIGAFRLSE